MRYHNSPNGPRPCKAQKGGCPYGIRGLPHFDTQQEAQYAYDQQMSESFGTLETLKRSKTEQVRQTSYNKVDQSLVLIKKTKASKPVQNTVKAMNAVRQSPQRARTLSARIKDKIKTTAIGINSKKTAFMENAKMRATESSNEFKAMVAVDEANRARRKTERKEKLQGAMSNVSQQYSTAKTKVGDMSISSSKNADNLKMGNTLEDGGKVVGIQTMGSEVYVSAIGPDNMISHHKYHNMDIIKTSNTVRERANSVKNSPLFRRIKAAAKQQRDVFYTLAGASEKRVPAASRIQSSVHEGNNARQKGELTFAA